MARINVTKSFLPPIKEYQSYLKNIWQSDILTNQGPLLNQFETAIKGYLDVNNFHMVSNGTIALQIALRSFGFKKGEIITTPFTYVATTSSILWEGFEPVFVDIEPDTFCIDAGKIEQAITSKTRAIMPVHVFGFPCDIAKIEEIAKQHGLKVIYDAAHAFGSTYRGKSLLDFGDITVCSFHATKPFHTIEGGGLIVKDKELSDKIELIKHFGHTGDQYFILGINAKASEFQAAMGLCNLKYIDRIIQARKKVSEKYDALFNKRFPRQTQPPDFSYNYAYYPLLLKSKNELLTKMSLLNQNEIFPRRYFSPSLNKLPYIENANSCPISEDIASRILCLPLYGDLEASSIEQICKLINK
jgi:dTDP-4-amino-4,6-dideoxygalactose transaminase